MDSGYMLTLQISVLTYRIHNISIIVESRWTVAISMYSSPHVIRPLPPKATLLIRPDFRCTEMVKYYLIAPPMKGHPHIRPFFHHRRGGL